MISFILPCVGFAQTASVTTLHSFIGPANGVSPCAALVRANDGNFYGTTQGGGPAEQGTIFTMTPAGTVTTLYTFGGSTGPLGTGPINADGSGPSAALVQGSDGRFYGTAASGGAYGSGTVYSLNAGGALTTLCSFSFHESGSRPTAALLQAGDGKFYGVTQEGGSDGNGTFFAVSSAGVLTVLHHFAQADGSHPLGTLVQDDAGNFYGTANRDGPSLGGTVFKVDSNGNLTVIHTFTGYNSDGANPVAGLVRGRDGNFYGTTTGGGSNGQGTVFTITPAGVLTTLHSFTSLQEGRSPTTALFQASDGAFYGTTDSTVFKITPAGELTTLSTLDGSSTPDQAGAALVPGPDGSFYSTFARTSTKSAGIIYRVTPSGTVSTIHVFDRSGSEGEYLTAKLAQGSNGSLYGVASRGGEVEGGTIFSLTLSGALRILHHFNNATDTGFGPQAGLLLGRDGQLYGTTAYGRDSSGTIYTITPEGVLTTVGRLPANGSCGQYPTGALIQSGDGTLYGTAPSGGGTGGSGTVFALNSVGSLTNLHTFTGNFRGGSSDGSLPYAALVQGGDGKLYGTTASGGTAGPGTVFSVTPTGAYQTLHSFTGVYDNTTHNVDGQDPQTELVQGTDGNFYGTTGEGGSSDQGTVFTITPAGALTILHSFGGGTESGYYPGAGLVQGDAGNFYGTTTMGGRYGKGTAFMITPGGVFTTIYHFTGNDGGGPSSTLVRASDGSLYGTTYAGGLYNLGTVFRLVPGGSGSAMTTAPDAQITCAHPNSLSQGDNGDVFSLTVTNVGNANTNGTVTVTVTPGQGVNIASMSGPGWTCSSPVEGGNSWICTRADALASGHYYPTMMALVNVSPNAATVQSGSLTSHVAAMGDSNPANNDSTETFSISAAPSTPTQQWRYQYFGTTANSGVAADSYIYAGDGLSNLLKYALNLNPKVPVVSPLTVDLNTGYLRLTIPRNPDATDLTFSVEVNNTDLTNPGAWTSAGTVVDQNTASLLQAHDSIPISQSSKQFIRLRVTR